jgi:hybrid polyketide synthase/nonribosomal peptide synthetase ACE1
VFSAVSGKSLSAVVAAYSDYLKTNPSVNLRALTHTLCNRRTTLPYRTSFSARDVDDLRAKLGGFVEHDVEKQRTAVSGSAPPLRILGIFTGQGAQWAGMARKLIQLPGAAKIVEHLEQSLSELIDPPTWSLKKEFLANPCSSRIMEPAVAQPACTAVQIILVDLLRAAGISFSAVVGHSSGEIGAAYAAGYLSATDAIRIGYYRGVHLGLVQGTNGESGGMIAVGTSYDEAERICDLEQFRGRLCVAASNSASSVTLSGDMRAVEEVKAIFEKENKFARLLRVDNACEFGDCSSTQADANLIRPLTSHGDLLGSHHRVSACMQRQSQSTDSSRLSMGF